MENQITNIQCTEVKSCLNEPKYSAEKEYETLRNEITQGKNYVFERPILIITASIALIQFTSDIYAIYYPIVVIGLLFFNLWTTVNRMESMARIIAYVQLVLEEKKYPWYGWETSLRKYRKCLNKVEYKVKIKDFKPDKDFYNDKIGFYPTIFLLHVVLTFSVFFILLVFTVSNLECKNLIWTLITFCLVIWFGVYAIRKKPQNIIPNIEWNREVWNMVFENWIKLNATTNNNPPSK